MSSPSSTRPRGRDVVCVGFSDWGKDTVTNEQHLLVRMVGDHRVLFVESLGLRRPQVAGRDLERMARRLVRGLQGPRAVDGLHVLSPLVLPIHDRAWARRFNAWVLPRLVRRATRRLGFEDPVLWTFVPQAEVLLDVLRPSTVVYYIDDDHGAKAGIDLESFRAAEERFTPRADVVLASAPALVDRLRPLNANIHLAPNVTDTAAFATALEPGRVDPALAALPEPRIVFVGAINAATVDVGLLRGLARARPGWSWVLVGPVRSDLHGLPDEPNVHLLGHRPYEALPEVLRGASAGMIPYGVDGAMASVFPMKTYEYLSAGLPVVSTPLPALEGVEEVERVAGVEAWTAALERALARDAPEVRRRRSAGVRRHSWEARVATLQGLFEDPRSPS